MMSERLSQARRKHVLLTDLGSVPSAARDFTPNEFRNAGFSMVEISIGLLLAMILAGFAVVNINGMLPGMRTNASLAQTVAQLRKGRETAIAQRREVEIKFLGNNQIQLVRHDLPAGTTVLNTITLENSVTFRLFPGLPDTPDTFGKAAAVDFGAAADMRFSTTGTLIDGNKNPLSGTVFLGLANHAETARAVTILGATGRVRGYRWTGTAWIQ
jgi:Tfp pilus assembly protein FimT